MDRNSDASPTQARRNFIGGSDARIVMGGDEAPLTRLWREKRGEVEPPDLSGELLVQLGTATERLNREWYQRQSGHKLHLVQARKWHPTIHYMAATLDGMVRETGAVFESKFMLPWSFSEQAAAEKHMAQLQHNMLVARANAAVLSIITGGGKWIELSIPADPLYQTMLIAAEKAFWQCVQTGEPPQPFYGEPASARIQISRIVDMSASNAWAEFAGLYRKTRTAHGEHERAKAELKLLVPEDAKEATGHGVRARRSRSGAISFDLVETEHVSV